MERLLKYIPSRSGSGSRKNWPSSRISTRPRKSFSTAPTITVSWWRSMVRGGCCFPLYCASRRGSKGKGRGGGNPRTREEKGKKTSKKKKKKDTVPVAIKKKPTTAASCWGGGQREM